MARFFVSKENIHNDIITITGKDVNHIKNVLRFKPGDQINICDGSSNDYIAIIEVLEKDTVKTKILDRIGNANEPGTKVILFQGIPKSDKMDTITQKNVELGIHSIYPIITDRTIVKVERGVSADKKTERWQRISLEAAKQSQRGIVPGVGNMLSFREALETAANNSELSIIPCLREKDNTIRKVLKNRDLKSVSVFIGPEGGFSDEELDLAEKSGVVPVTLGPRVLRTDTAGFVVLSLIMYERGDLG